MRTERCESAITPYRPLDMGSINSGPSPETTLLDYHQLETFAIIGAADYIELLDEVIVDVPEQLDQIRAAIEEGNGAQVKARVHGLRGLVAYFGCVALTARLARLEIWDELSPGQAAAIHLELLALWDQSLKALRQWEKTQSGFAL